jgi:hypothetical protein
MTPIDHSVTQEELIDRINQLQDKVNLLLDEKRSLGGTLKMQGNIDMNGHRIINSALFPDNQGDVVPKNYLNENYLSSSKVEESALLGAFFHSS